LEVLLDLCREFHENALRYQEGILRDNYFSGTALEAQGELLRFYNPVTGHLLPIPPEERQARQQAEAELQRAEAEVERLRREIEQLRRR